MRLVCNVSCVFEIVPTFLWFEEVADVACGAPQRVIGSCLGLSEQGLELGEGHLDGIEVW